ncbi:hypothetical protein RHGRI_006344 [Rhododendron griersonianum]|uniref:ARM repeat superfamily protein n=1 Tax=Rhododendron griersonianum TaxID=479676 RepID=A0AAV6KSQ1_9ERIC|nr:hypothetical protein RHGRI_006344 [Rhododendron griersonianum]
MEQEQAMWTSPESNSMVSATIGRAMSTLLSARPKKLEDAVSRLDSAPQRSSVASLEESLRILHSYVTDAAKREEPMDGVLVPMIEHSLKYKESKYGNQAMILFNWLFQDEVIFQALATNLASIIMRKEDRYIALGWCMLVRGLVGYEIKTKQLENNGLKQKYSSLLKIFSSCITHLVSVVCNGSCSTLQGGFELPTRLAVAAADCTLALTTALTKKDLFSNGSDEKPKQSNSNLSSLPTTWVPGEKRVKPASRCPEVSVEMNLLLWDHLDELIILVQRLIAWSRKSRSLHAEGLDRVLKWLQGIKGSHAHVQNEAGSHMLNTGVLILSSCWKYYGMLMHLEDYQSSQHYKELLDQYLSGIQFYAENHTEEYTENKDSGIETIKFFLNCLSLLLGRLDGKRFENTLSEDGLRISRVLISQLHCADAEVIDGAVCLLKAVIFRSNYSLAGSSSTDTREMDAVLPLLLHLLDERDGTARAVVVLIAEYCSISTDSRCLQEVLNRLASGDVVQRRNAVDVMSELFRISPHLVHVRSMFLLLIFGRQDIANHLLERLGDEESIVRTQASYLIPMMDPSLVLPALVGLLYSSDEALQSSASNTFVAVLKYHNKSFEVLCMLFSCLSDLCQNPDLPEASEFFVSVLMWNVHEYYGVVDQDRLTSLEPAGSATGFAQTGWKPKRTSAGLVEEWNLLVEPLIDKLFAEPSNAIIVKFLSYISEQLADAADVVFHRILLRTRQPDEWKSHDSEIDNHVKLAHSLFDRLCPLLIIRLLPLRVFNNLNSSLMYGVLRDKAFLLTFLLFFGNPNTGYFDINDPECVAGILLNRAFNNLEFDDVRKLAAELSGRIHPQVLFPIIASQLEDAANDREILKIKACLFALCTSFVIRGRDSIVHPAMLEIRNTIETILLWPSLDGDEVSKAQHGCIDCLALMICTELQDPELFRDLTTKKSSLVRTPSWSRDAAMRNSVLSCVINQLTNDKIQVSSAKRGNEGCSYESSMSLSFRMCMANVLISACQKMPNSGKKPFARKVLPHLIQSAEMIMESEIRAAFVQVFFSAVYHLKSAVLPYASDLLKVSLKSLTDGSDKEKVAGAKLMASLMASEVAILESIAGGLLDARTILSSILSSLDTSPEVRQVCNQLLACLTSP